MVEDKKIEKTVLLLILVASTLALAHEESSEVNDAKELLNAGMIIVPFVANPYRSMEKSKQLNIAIMDAFWMKTQVCRYILSMMAVLCMLVWKTQGMAGLP